MRTPEWIEAFRADELEVGGARVVRAAGAQVAVFRPAEHELYAVDNQCPHEGYPLAKGWVKDCVVTCPWHNFKFDLRDGRCVLGDEQVRTYPLRVVDGRVQIDVAGPDPDEERPRLLAGLDEALWRGKLGQAAREVVRLLRLGTPPEQIALAAARFDARHGEYGTGHATPLAVNALAIAARYPGVDAVLPLMQPLDMASDSHRFRPPRPTPAPVDPGPDPDAAGRRLRALVEAEEADAAEALLRGALARGWGRDVVEPWLYRLCADHFLDFGHALIYQVKLFDLLALAGWEHAPDLLPAHLCGIVYGTREDALPEWAWLRRHLDALAPRFADLAAGRDDGVDRAPLVDALLDAPRDDMVGAVVGALAGGASLRALVNAISIAAAHRLLRFDVNIDADPTVQEGWLDVTHTLTYASALRYAVERYREPDVVRLVLYGCRFVHNARALDLPPERRVSPAPADGDPVEAIARRDAPAAVARAAGWLAAGRDPARLRAAIEDHALDDALTRPIVVAHLIKTCAAAFDEHRATGRPEPVLALVRLAASPVRERRVRRLAHEAVRFVVHGKVPRTLT